MFITLKGFASKTISASKGKVIEIKDKSVAKSLLNAGFIAPYTKQNMSDKEKDEEIKNLKNQVSEKDGEIESLNDRIIELEVEKEDLVKKLNNPISDDEENLDNDDSTGNDSVDDDENDKNKE